MKTQEFYEVAISYASEDTGIADTVATRLLRDGYGCFYNPNRLHKLLGLSLSGSLEKIYGNPNTVVVALISSSYLTKRWPQLEFAKAINREPCNLIVVKIGDCVLPSKLRDISYISIPFDGGNRGDIVSRQISATLESQFNISHSLRELEVGSPLSKTDDIAILDHPDSPYSTQDITFVDADPLQTIDVYTDDFEFDDLDSYISLKTGRGVLDLDVTKQDILSSKFLVREQVDHKKKSGWEIFNGKKFGVSAIRRSRTPETENHLLNVILYETDYFSSLFSKKLYHRLKKRGAISPDVSGGLNKYAGLMRSFGFDILLFAPKDGKPHVIFARRSNNVANAIDSSLQWHVSMNEGLSLSDRYSREFHADATVYRGFQEELGLFRREISHLDLFEPFIEMKNFEPALIGAAYTTLDLETIVARAERASDSMLERDSSSHSEGPYCGNSGILALPAEENSICDFLSSGEPMTHILEFTLKRFLERGLFAREANN